MKTAAHKIKEEEANTTLILLDYEDPFKDYINTDKLYITKTNLFVISLVGFVYMSVLYVLCGTQWFVGLFNGNFFLMNLCICGVSGIILAIFKNIALLWCHSDAETFSPCFRKYAKFVAVYYVVYCIYCFAVALFHLYNDLLNGIILKYLIKP